MTLARIMRRRISTSSSAVWQCFRKWRWMFFGLAQPSAAFVDVQILAHAVGDLRSIFMSQAEQLVEVVLMCLRSGSLLLPARSCGSRVLGRPPEQETRHASAALTHSGLEFLLTSSLPGASSTSPTRHGRITHQPEDAPYGRVGQELPCSSWKSQWLRVVTPDSRTGVREHQRRAGRDDDENLGNRWPVATQCDLQWKGGLWETRRLRHDAPSFLQDSGKEDVEE